MKTKHLFVMNPTAGKKSCVDSLTAAVKKAFDEREKDPDEYYVIRVTSCHGDAINIVREEVSGSVAAGEFVRIYSCGGDGTLNEVINGAVGFDNCAVCAVPVGSGNDFVKTIENVPISKFTDMPSCINGEIKSCDLLRVDDRYSINIISLGLDAIAGIRQCKFKKWPLVSGSFAYKLALVTALITSIKNHFTYEIDGEVPDFGGESTLAVLGNGRWYGGGFKAAPLADISDGLIDFIVADAVSRLQFLRRVSGYKRGEHIGKFSFIHYKQAKSVRIFTGKEVPMQIDGEMYMVKDPLVEIVPAAIKIIIPA